MKNLAKKIVVGMMAGSLFFAGAGEVFAADGRPPHLPQNQQQSEAQIKVWAKHISEWSGVAEKDILDSVKSGRMYNDVEFAALLSKISKKSFKDVLAMKTDWFGVMKKLGITREKYESAVEELEIKEMSKEAGVDEATVKSLLEKHYHPRDIVIAGKIAKASGKNIQEILDMKKINQRWRDIADELKIDRKDLGVEDPPPPPPQQ